MRISCRTLVVLVALSLTLASCSKRRPARHLGGAGETAAAIVPTPDNTPVEALRTPAGLVLKEGPETTATPPPGTTGAVSPAAGTKS